MNEIRETKTTQPAQVRSNFVRNLAAGVGIVMYWGAMWNLLDEYVDRPRRVSDPREIHVVLDKH